MPLDGEKPIEDVTRDGECRAVREVENPRRAENQREAHRSEGVDRADLQSVDEKLKQQHGCDGAE